MLAFRPLKLGSGAAQGRSLVDLECYILVKREAHTLDVTNCAIITPAAADAAASNPQAALLRCLIEFEDAYLQDFFPAARADLYHNRYSIA